MRRVILALAVFVCMTVSAGAAQTFIALVDLEKQVLWIPEGTAVPAGVEFYLEPDEELVASVDRAEDGTAGTAVASPDASSGRRRLVYAYAPAEKFTAARQRIAELQKGIQPLVADYDQYFYFYFYDGSYHAARKYIRNIPNYPYSNSVQYGTDSVVYDVGGNYDAKATVSRVTQFSGLNISNTCWFYGSSGTCSIPLGVVQTTPSYTGSMTSKGSLVRYLYGPCETCKEILNSSIVINFP